MSDDWDIARIERLAPDANSITAARKLLKKKAFTAIQPTADGGGWWAKCAGQTDDYEVSAKRPTAGNFDTNCTCPSYKHPCKHAIALLIYLAENPAERPGPPQPQTAPSGDFEGLLANVFENPDDDLARLVFADFVEEQGDIDRATMIRLQVERASKPAPGKKPRGRPPLPKAEAALAEKLLAGVPESARPDFRWRRGFLVYKPQYAEVFAPETWPESARHLFRDGWVEAVILFEQWFDLTAGLVALYRQVGTLDFGSIGFGAETQTQAATELRPGEPGSRIKHVVVPKHFRDQWQALLDAEADAPVRFDAVPHRAFADPPPRLFARQVAAGILRGVRHLEFEGRLTPEVARIVAASPDAAWVELLNIHGMTLDAETADILSRSPHLGVVQGLILHDIDWTPDAAAAWVGSRLASGVTYLALESCGPFGDAELAAFRDRSWPRLEALELPADGPTWAGVRRLLAAGTMPRLERFSWEGPAGTPVDPLRLRLEQPAGPREMRFESVALHVTPAGRPGRHRLEVAVSDLAQAWPVEARSLDWASVSEVGITNAAIDPGWFALLAACFPDGLDALEIHADGWMKVAHAKALAAVLPTLRLRSLGLVRAGLGVRSVQALVSSPGAASLRRLDLSNNPLQDSAVAAIADSPHLGQLEELTVRGPIATSAEAFAATLRKRLPKTTRVVAT